MSEWINAKEALRELAVKWGKVSAMSAKEITEPELAQLIIILDAILNGPND